MLAPREKRDSEDHFRFSFRFEERIYSPRFFLDFTEVVYEQQVRSCVRTASATSPFQSAAIDRQHVYNANIHVSGDSKVHSKPGHQL